MKMLDRFFRLSSEFSIFEHESDIGMVLVKHFIPLVDKFYSMVEFFLGQLIEKDYSLFGNNQNMIFGPRSAGRKDVKIISNFEHMLCMFMCKWIKFLSFIFEDGFVLHISLIN